MNTIRNRIALAAPLPLRVVQADCLGSAGSTLWPVVGVFASAVIAGPTRSSIVPTQQLWLALHASFPRSAVLTEAGLAVDTGKLPSRMSAIRHRRARSTQVKPQPMLTHHVGSANRTDAGWLIVHTPAPRKGAPVRRAVLAHSWCRSNRSRVTTITRHGVLAAAALTVRREGAVLAELGSTQLEKMATRVPLG
jgi:hypothetical protein